MKLKLLLLINFINPVICSDKKLDQSEQAKKACERSCYNAFLQFKQRQLGDDKTGRMLWEEYQKCLQQCFIKSQNNDDNPDKS